MDWDLDGVTDILSGCYWTDETQAGQIQFLKGKSDGEFEASVSLKNAKGQPLENVQLDEGADLGSEQVLTICTEQHAADLDADGDLDLVVGCFANKFYFYENKAKAGQPPALAEPIELPVSIAGHHAAPHLCDWDGDGDLDLLSGSSEGGVFLSVNEGSAESFSFAEFQELLPTSTARQQETAKGQIEIAPSTRVWATDFNHDGKLDLLVGDCVSLVSLADDVDQVEAAQQYAKDRTRLAELEQQRQPLLDKYMALLKKSEDSELSEEEQARQKELMEEMSGFAKEMNEIQTEQSKYMQYKATGHVWLLIRK